MKEILYSVSDIRRLVGLSRQTIYTWLNDGRIQPTFRLRGDGAPFFTAGDVEQVRTVKRQRQRLRAERAE